MKGKAFFYALCSAFMAQGVQALEVDRSNCTALGIALHAEATVRKQELVADMFKDAFVSMYMRLNQYERLGTASAAAQIAIDLGDKTKGNAYYDVTMDLWLECSVRYAE